MNSTAYTRIGKVYFQKDNAGSGFNYVNRFENNYDQITIGSVYQIDFVYRGWLGDVTYWAADGIDVKNPEKADLTSEPCCIKDVLCVRVNVTYDGDAPVMWEYVFLKY